MVMPLWDENPFQRKAIPYVTWTLIAANVIIFLFEAGAGEAAQQAMTAVYGMTPAAVISQSAGIPSFPPQLTLVTYQFLHGDLLHLLGNMIFLWVFGDNIEDALGPVRFLGFYLLSGVAAAGLQIAVDPHSAVPLIGASGAVAGVIAAYMMVRPCAKVTVLLLRFLVKLDAYWVVGGWAVLQLVSLGSNDGVAYWAHIGGLAAGAVLLPIMRQPHVRLFECIRTNEAAETTATET